MPAGRPLILLESYPDQQSLRAACQAYFDERKASDTPVTLSGLALHLGCDLRTLQRYAAGEGNREEFRQPLKWAWQAIADEYERRGSKTTGNPAFSIFALKNLGWSDRQETAISLEGDAWGAILSKARQRPPDEPE